MAQNDAGPIPANSMIPQPCRGPTSIFSSPGAHASDDRVLDEPHVAGLPCPIETPRATRTRAGGALPIPLATQVTTATLVLHLHRASRDPATWVAR
jgi:hypothetical protein